MKRWEIINKALREATEGEFNEMVTPLQEELQKHMKSGLSLKGSFREVRAQLLQDLKFSLALLDAAAYEEEQKTKN